MSIIDFIFPKMCIFCGKNGDYLCSNCFGEIQKLNSFCPYCRQYAYGGRTHPSCRKKLGLDGVIVLWKYAGNMRKLILKLKYNFSYDIAEFLADKISHELDGKTRLFNDAIFVPVPLHNTRERWRGFNQEREVCKKLCELNNWRIEELLVRKKETRIQAKLKGDERKKNVKDVFAINFDLISCDGSEVFYCSSNRPDEHRGYYENSSLIALKSKSNINKVVIFDDVWTSGSTIKECARVLKKAGACEVWGMAIAG